MGEKFVNKVKADKRRHLKWTYSELLNILSSASELF